MIRAASRFLLFSSILLAGYWPAAAWDETGHKITSYIAWQRMTPSVRERVIRILREAPEDAQLSTFYASYGARTEEARKREFFMLASTWADIVRDRAFAVRYRKYNKGNWHYSDEFWRVTNGRIEYLSAPEDGGQGLARLQEFDKLITSNAKDEDKAIAIAWLEHLIGDLHQPLHTSARVTDTEPNGDQGGNLFLLTPPGTPRSQQVNLHGYWDTIIGRAIPNNKNACDADYMEPIAQKMMKDYPYARLQGRLAAGQFERWVKDSLTLAQTEVFSADLKRFELPRESYRKNAFRIAREQLTLAGYRMGDMFNRAFTIPALGAPQ